MKFSMSMLTRNRRSRLPGIENGGRVVWASIILMSLALFSAPLCYAGGYLEDLAWGPDSTSSELSVLDLNNELQLLHVTSDAMSGAVDIKALVDNQMNLQGFKYITEKGGVQNFNLEQLNQGTDLFKDGDRSVVKITAQKMNPSAGGILEMVYLTDGLANNYEKFEMAIVHSQSGWEITTKTPSGMKRFTKMVLKGNWFFGKVIGISGVSVK